MKITWAKLAIVVAVLLVAVGAYAYFRGGDGAERGFVTETVTRGDVAATVTASGTVNPVINVQVGTYVSGPVKAIYADFNSKVSKGQIVAKIDPAPFQVKVGSAEAAVANAQARVAKDRADLSLKKLTLDRNRELLQRKLISQNDLDTARSNYDQALAQLAVDQASVKQSQADLGAAQINLAYTDIRSPVDGIVVSRSVDVGQTVAASLQTPTLFQIAQDLTKMQVDTNVSESDIGGVAVDQPVVFHVDAYPGKDFHGKVVQVRNAPTTVQNVVTYDVVIGVENPNLELRPGMTATATITTAERDDVLRIPLAAMRFRPERARGETPSPRRTPGGPADGGSAGGGRKGGNRGPSVWVVKADGTLARVRVETGVRDDRYAEVVSGELTEKDTLAIAYKRPPSEAAAPQQRQSDAFRGMRRALR
jgi:HlyD family secretion protein